MADAQYSYKLVDGVANTPAEIVSATMARQWRGLSQFGRKTLSEPGSMAGSPLVNVQLIAAMALTVFPSTTMRLGYVLGPGRVAPAAPRRAVVTSTPTPRKPVMLADVAAAAGTTSRAVQAASQRHYGTTPTRYLRRVRLEGARCDLRVADPDSSETVAAVAVHWGFGHAARFTGLYRQQFCVPPAAPCAPACPEERTPWNR